MEWLSGFGTGCLFEKDGSASLCPGHQLLTSISNCGQHPSGYRGGTKLTFITCRGMRVKPFGGVLPELQNLVLKAP
jgi:hypothetical protein